MKPLIFVAALIASVTLPTTVPAQTVTNGTPTDMCHMFGSWASEAVRSRRYGVPISEVMHLVRNMSLTAKPDPAMQPAVALLVAEVERIVLAVYASDISQNDAYLKYRGECQKAMTKK